MVENGYTLLPNNERRKKSDVLVEALGALDELNAALGLLRAAQNSGPEPDRWQAIQCYVLQIGGALATATSLPEPSGLARLGPPAGGTSAPGFVLSGANEISARAHWARVICRRAERVLVALADQEPQRVSPVALQYLNRLSGVLFEWARVAAGPAAAGK